MFSSYCQLSVSSGVAELSKCDGLHQWLRAIFNETKK